ncbi:unnamed protein product [Cylicocyclus nassatus]|uniref:Elongation factor-like GTPase 1 domain-containing protein n=1 Tax=Cylicocyclus nassatus TaxID=53992 RepID=A0AA36GH58_CYLNA|nr:unnamed protein product [Cylicocyclus nassatus]
MNFFGAFVTTHILKPFVPLLETTVSDLQVTSIQIQEQTTECHLRSDSIHIRLRVASLPDEVVSLLEESAEILKSIRGGHVDDTTLTEFKAKLLAVGEESLLSYRGCRWYRKSEEEIAELVERAEPKLTFTSMEFLAIIESLEQQRVNCSSVPTLLKLFRIQANLHHISR